MPSAIAVRWMVSASAPGTISFWIADPASGQNNVRSDVNLAILRTLDAAGVAIPFPQRVVRNA